MIIVLSRGGPMRIATSMRSPMRSVTRSSSLRSTVKPGMPCREAAQDRCDVPPPERDRRADPQQSHRLVTPGREALLGGFDGVQRPFHLKE